MHQSPPSSGVYDSQQTPPPPPPPPPLILITFFDRVQHECQEARKLPCHLQYCLVDYPVPNPVLPVHSIIIRSTSLPKLPIELHPPNLPRPPSLGATIALSDKINISLMTDALPAPFKPSTLNHQPLTIDPKPACAAQIALNPEP